MMEVSIVLIYISSLLAACYVSYMHNTLMHMKNSDALTKSSYPIEMEEKIHVLEVQVQQLQKLLQEENTSLHTIIGGLPKDCLELFKNGTKTDGVYSISPDGRCPFFVYCDMTNGGWTLIQNQIDSKVSFYRPWNEYVSGFGDVEGSHWIGLEKIHRLTRDGSQIYFDIENYDGTKSYAHYKVFTVQGAATAYTMNVDAFNYEGSIDELLSYHNNMKFSTYDRDNDVSQNNCCLQYLDGGGWWYKDCYRLGNVNGVFGKTAQGGIGYWTTKNVPISKVTIKLKNINGQCLTQS